MYCKCHTPYVTDFLLSPHTLSFYYGCSLLILHTFSHTAQPSLHTADATLLVLNTFSTRTPDVTFLILQTFSSHHTPCLSATDVPFFIVCTLSSHLAQPSPRTSDATLLVLHTFFICTADVTLLILQIFSSNSTPCVPPENVASWCCSLSSHTAQPYPHTRQPSLRTADATLLVLHTSSPGTADVTFLILQTFFLTPCSLFFYCTCNPSDTVKSILTLHNVLMFPSYAVYFSSCCKIFSSYCRCNPCGTEHILYWYYRCDIPYNEDFLYTQHTLSSYCRCNPPDIVHSLITLHKLFLILQMRPCWYRTLSLLVLQM